MANSRELILNKIRSRSNPYYCGVLPKAILHVSPVPDLSGTALESRFISELSSLGNSIYLATNENNAAQIVLEIIGGDQKILAWDINNIPLKGIDEKLKSAGVSITKFNNPEVRVSLSGADAALAATGSLVISSAPGKYRSTSILSRIHIVVLTKDQIVANIETWIVKQRETNLDAFRKASNTVIITGASRTADITGEVIIGMHGPGELHVVLL